jgi:hypothetical protein
MGKTLASTGTDHFGAVVGNNCAIGASVLFYLEDMVKPTALFRKRHFSGIVCKYPLKSHSRCN